MILSAMLAATIMMAESSSTATPSNVTAATPAPAAAAQTKTAEAKPVDHIVCKSEAVTGSLFPKKTCRSTKDAAQIQQEERANLEKIQNEIRCRRSASSRRPTSHPARRPLRPPVIAKSLGPVDKSVHYFER